MRKTLDFRRIKSPSEREAAMDLYGSIVRLIDRSGVSIRAEGMVLKAVERHLQKKVVEVICKVAVNK